MEIVLCCPTLGNYKTANIASMIRCLQTGIFKGFILSEAALLPWSRNYLIQQALKIHPDLTHIMFIDDDMCDFDSWHIERLVNANKDIISGLMTMRLPPYKIVSNFEDNTKVTEYLDNSMVIKAIHTGMAFTLIKREVLNDLNEGNNVWFNCDREPRENFEEEIEEFVKNNREDFWVEDKIREAIIFGQMSHIGTDLVGEDVGFCKRAKHLGFSIWVDCGVIISHLGLKAHNVNTQVEYNKQQEDLNVC